MSVDPDDRTPLGIKNTGARIAAYGVPLLPGAMTLVAYYRQGETQVPVLGLPACVLYSKITALDFFLPRLMAGDPISREDLALLGEGGLWSG
jgi:molybdopterin biosynthesis enzyme